LFDYLQQTTKPTTVIYDNAINLAENVLADNGSVAIRICNDEFCKHLIKRFRKPIVSTSANLSGMPSPAMFAEIDETIKQGVDYVVKYRQKENTPAQASSIIKWNVGGTVEIIRK
jgi:L-threonylcarbamoyladenylate synthase